VATGLCAQQPGTGRDVAIHDAGGVGAMAGRCDRSAGARSNERRLTDTRHIAIPGAPHQSDAGRAIHARGVTVQGAVATWYSRERRLTSQPGRYRSLYRTRFLEGYMNSANDIEICRDKQRRNKVRAKHRNGLDYVEVGPGQLTLKLFFIGEAPHDLTTANFRIDGGARISGMRVTGATRVNRGDEDLDDYWRLTVDRFGDFSTYTLRIVKAGARGRPGNEPPADFDSRYSRLEFTFKSDCPSDLDCKAQTICPPVQRPEPEINYLAKDYASFRQLILDRLAVVMPDWKERHVPDLVITLVEVLAYTGDYLSYYQDAVATEAYLDTARQRISVRRHTRLVDYALHEGCNARAWVAVETSQDDELDPAYTFFITGHNDVLRVSGAMLIEDDLRGIP